MNIKELRAAVLAGDVEALTRAEDDLQATRAQERAERAAALVAERAELETELAELRPQHREAHARVRAATDAIQEARRKRDLLAREAGAVANQMSFARDRLAAIEVEQADIIAEIRREADITRAPVVHDLRYRR